MKDKIIREVYQILEERREHPTESYTSRLMMDDNEKKAEDKILEKIGEEAAEVIIASKNNEHLVYEATDLIFHTLVLLTYKGVKLEEIFNEFERRRRD
ncbi:MAG: phosphoribosyl-ATP diphosphatase [Methanobacterium sp.]|nr:phosphoribosyl-ATP diphosphatase [Methanobacterium sp.]